MNLVVMQQNAERIGTTAAMNLMNLCDTEGERQVGLLVLIRQIQYHLMCNLVADAQISNHVDGRPPFGRSEMMGLFGPLE